jgi:hypothetical protein
MNELLIALVAVVPAILVGVLTYLSTRHRIQEDRGTRLFDDALELSTAYKKAYKEAADDMACLKGEIDELRAEVGHLIKEGEMWRNVAVAAFLDQEDTDPHWWPKDEPRPRKGGKDEI